MRWRNNGHQADGGTVRTMAFILRELGSHLKVFIRGMMGSELCFKRIMVGAR